MNVKFKNIQVKAVFLGDKQARWSPDNYNNSRVTVKNIDSGVKIKFNFWGSIVNPELSTEQDLLEALSCFMSDAQSGAMEFEDFCSEFGHDVDPIKAKQTWKACKKSLKKVEELFGDYLQSSEVSEFARKLNEKING